MKRLAQEGGEVSVCIWASLRKGLWAETLKPREAQGTELRGIRLVVENGGPSSVRSWWSLNTRGSRQQVSKGVKCEGAPPDR